MPQSDFEESSNIVASSKGRVLSLRVDEVISVEEVDPGMLRPPPASLGPALRRLARGVVDTGEGIALLVDVEAIALAARPKHSQSRLPCQ